MKTSGPAPAPDDWRDQRVADHLHLVPRIARAFRARVLGNHRIEIDDLVAYDRKGLLDAASRFDAMRGRRAYRRLRDRRLGIVDRAANDPGSAVVLPAGIPIFHAEKGTRAEGEEYRFADIAEGGEAGQGARWNGRRMLQVPVEDDDTLQALAAANLSLLPERERRLLELRYYHGKTVSQAAGEMGFRRSWASRLHARALATLGAAMHAYSPYRQPGGNEKHTSASEPTDRSVSPAVTVRSETASIE